MNAHERQTHDDALDRGAPIPCPVCTGAEDAEPCSEECRRIHWLGTLLATANEEIATWRARCDALTKAHNEALAKIVELERGIR